VLDPPVAALRPPAAAVRDRRRAADGIADLPGWAARPRSRDACRGGPQEIAGCSV